MSRSSKGPRFTIGNNNAGSTMMIYDDDFGYDAAFELSGDWEDDQKEVYAQKVCDALNAADIPVRPPDSELETASEPKP